MPLLCTLIYMHAYNKLVQERRVLVKSLSDFSEEELESDKEEITEKDLKEAYDKYKDLPEDELLKELYKEIDRQKKNGSFDIENLKFLVNSMAPMLTPEQLNNINALLERIK